MNTRVAFPGFGFSPEALEASWRELEQGQPEKGPDCPLTADLLDLALGLATGQRETDLHHHLKACGYCNSRFQAQSRSARYNSHPEPSATVPTLREQIVTTFGERLHAVRKGKLVQEETRAADDGREVRRQFWRLQPRDGKGAELLNLFLEWTPSQGTARSGTGGQAWSVLFWLAVEQTNQESTRDRSDPLDWFDRRQVRLTLTPADRSWVRVVETQLNRDNTEPDAIVSNPVVIHLDHPEHLANVEFAPGDLVQEHDAS
jgi:hypothetical protein